jgi:hypothetical protein
MTDPPEMFATATDLILRATYTYARVLRACTALCSRDYNEGILTKVNLKSIFYFFFVPTEKQPPGRVLVVLTPPAKPTPNQQNEKKKWK